MAYDVFICCSPKDGNHADMLCHVLEEEGIRCYHPLRDAQQPQKSGMMADIIESCGVLVYILSRYSKDSQEVLSQLNIAVSAGLMIVTLQADESDASKEARYYLADAHWLDIQTPPYEEKMRKVCVWVHDWLKQQPGRKTRYAKKLRLKSLLVWLAVILAIGAIGYLLWPKQIQPLTAFRDSVYIDRMFTNEVAAFCGVPDNEGVVEIMDLTDRGRTVARLTTPFAGGAMNTIINEKGTVAIVNQGSRFIAYDVSTETHLYEFTLEEQNPLINFLWQADDLLLEYSSRPDFLCDHLARIDGRTGEILARYDISPMNLYGVTKDGTYLAGYDAGNTFSLVSYAEPASPPIQGAAALKLCVGNVPDTWDMFSPGGVYFCEVSTPDAYNVKVYRCDTAEVVYRGEFSSVGAAVLCMDGENLFLNTEKGYTKLNFMTNTSIYVLKDIFEKDEEEFANKIIYNSYYDKTTGLLFMIISQKGKPGFYIFDTDRGEVLLKAYVSTDAQYYYEYALNGRCLIMYYDQDLATFSMDYTSVELTRDKRTPVTRKVLKWIW